MSGGTYCVYYVDERNPALGVSPLVETDLRVICDPSRVGGPLVERITARLDFWSCRPLFGSKVELRANRNEPPAYSFLFLL
jgi:hypothetical protein